MREDYLNPQMNTEKVRNLSLLALAHVGDGVYELLIRTYLAEKGLCTAQDLHEHRIRLVNAAAKANAAHEILDELTEEERNVFRRGRNAHVSGTPPHADPAQYHEATGLEALFGYLYLLGRHERLNALFQKIMEMDHAT